MQRNARAAVGLILLVAGVIVLFVHTPLASDTKAMQTVERVDVEKTRELVQAGQVMLVCAYDDESCRPILFEGAFLKSDFEKQVPSLDPDQALVFYCA